MTERRIVTELPSRACAGCGRASHRHLAADRRHGEDHHLLHVRLPLRHQSPHEGRKGPLHRGQPRSPGEQGRTLRQGSAGIMTQYSPARLQKPLMRVGERGYRRVPRDRMGRGAAHRHDVALRDPRHRSEEARFFTGRDQSQALTGWWAAQFGTPNYGGAWRLLLGQYGGGRALHDRRLVLGVRRAGFGRARAIS